MLKCVPHAFCKLQRFWGGAQPILGLSFGDYFARSQQLMKLTHAVLIYTMVFPLPLRNILHYGLSPLPVLISVQSDLVSLRYKLNQEKKDSGRWKTTSKGEYKVSETYKIIRKRSADETMLMTIGSCTN